jgi:hypothetical protein
MIQHRELRLKSQKYVGIKTRILFKDHDHVDFYQLQKSVIEADISHVDCKENFMALDTDFSRESFSYLPLMPVESFEDNEGFDHFTRQEGDYYAFEVLQKDCSPEWFKEVFSYIDSHGLSTDKKDYDLEYYPEDYLKRFMNNDFKLENQVFTILFKKKDL